MTESSYTRVPVLQRQMRDFAIVGAIAILIATIAFVAVRNTELAARQIDLAKRGAHSIATDTSPLPTVHSVLVSPATPSKKHPYLRHRKILDATDAAWRVLAGATDQDPKRLDDKLFYDAATRFDRSGPFAELMKDGSGRAIAAEQACNDAARMQSIVDDLERARAEAVAAAPDAKPASAAAASTDAKPASAAAASTDAKPASAAATDAKPASAAAASDAKPASTVAASPDGARSASTRLCAIAIAVTAPAAPAPYPFLVIIGVLGLGAALAAAGALIGRRAGHVGMFAGIVALAVPTMLWQAWIATTAIILLGAAVALAQRAALTDRIASGLTKNRAAVGFLAPAAAAMLVLVAAPFVIGIVLGFYDHHHGTWTFVGIDNFVEILSGGGRPLEDPLNFWFILGVTVLWTLANVALHVTIGVLLALALSRKWMAGRGIFRMLLILPWAIPNYITALIWNGMFKGEYGAINSLLHQFGLDGVSWFSSWATAFSANVITNTWLGFPFMMVVALGALETIPRELYEAASVDGASAWQRFRHITLPHLRPALGPAVALGSIWTFNMFNVIFLVSGGQPGNSTNILVTDAYRWAFERGERYGMAAAYATIIFLVLLLWTVFGTRIVRSKEDAS